MANMNASNVAAAVFNIKHILIVVLVLSFIGSMSGVQYNVALFLFGLYALFEHNSVQPLRYFGAFTAFSIISDITILAVYTYPSALFRFALAMDIICLLMKPVLIFLSIRLLGERGSPISYNPPSWVTGGQQQQADEDGAPAYASGSTPATGVYVTVGDNDTMGGSDGKFYSPPPMEGQAGGEQNYQQM